MSDLGPKTFTPTPRALCRGGGRRVWINRKTWGWRTDVTPRQRDVYLFIRYFWREFGYAPSYREVAHGLNLKHKQNIVRICKVLRTKKLIDMDGSYRGLKPHGVSIERLVINRRDRATDGGWK